MAQVQDLSGLLTGISSQAPIDPRVGLTPMQQLQARGMASSEATRKAAGGLMSSIAGREVNVQTSPERAQSELAGLDINDPKDQPRILEIYTRLDPNKAAQLKAAFAQQGRDRLASTAQADLEQKRYDDQQALENRKVTATESQAATAATNAAIAAANAAKPKVYPPKILHNTKDNTFSVVSTDPANAGEVINTGSTQTEAQILADENKKTQEKENNIRSLVTKRNILGGQADLVRLALEEAEAEARMPLAANLQLQATSPMYGAAISGNTYKELAAAIKGVNSQQALNTVAEMKAQSSTGATGLGATNAMEFQALESNIRSLDALVPSQIESALQAIERNLDNIIRVNQGKEPNIDWTRPEYAHMIYDDGDGGNTYSYDGITFYELPLMPLE